MKSPHRQVVLRALLLGLMGLLTGFAACRTATETQPSAAHRSGVVLEPDEGEVLLWGLPPRGPSGRVIIKVDPENSGSTRLSMGVQHLEGRIPVHLHEGEEEILFIHAGEGTATLGEQTVPVQAGTTIYVPQGVWHGVENTQEEPMQVVWVVAPTGFENYFRGLGTPAGSQPKSLTPEQIAAIMERHGVRLKSE